MPNRRGEAEDYCNLWVDIALDIMENKLDNASDEVCAAVMNGCMNVGAARVVNDYSIEDYK